MPRYSVKELLSHDKKDYVAGSTVEMTEEQAASLIALGVIGEGAGESTRRINATDTIALVKTLQTADELDQLAAENQDRKSVLDAIEEQRKELEQ